MNWLRNIIILLIFNLFILISYAQVHIACIGDSVTKGYGIKMVPSYDVGDSLDVHPTEKYVIGQRLANLVLKHQHQYSLQADSPYPLVADYNSKSITLSLSNATQLKTLGTNKIKELDAILSTGETVGITNAIIKGNKIIIPNTLRKVRRIIYAYRPYSGGNLINEAGVPVSTFSVNLL